VRVCLTHHDNLCRIFLLDKLPEAKMDFPTSNWLFLLRNFELIQVVLQAEKDVTDFPLQLLSLPKLNKLPILHRPGEAV
jgi:hypothetical protein